MTEFELFDKLVNRDNKGINDEGCKHMKINEDNNCCEDCGLHIEKNLLFNKEWKFNNSRNTRDPTRCQFRKTNEKSIVKDIETLCFPDNIVQEANQIYQDVVNGRIYRGNTRRSIIFACIFYAYKKMNQPQSCDALTVLFNLERKDALKGLKIVKLNSNKNIDQNSYITPEDIIKEFMLQFKADTSEISNVIKLYSKIKDKKSLILSRSRPQSIASGVIRYYILRNDKDISIENFKEIVKLSELTINKIVKEITKLLDN